MLENKMYSSLQTDIQNLKGPIVIFGAGGFIGANLFRTLLKVREDVYAVTHQKFIPWRLVGLPLKNIIYGDLNSEASVKHIFETYQFKTIFNLSAYGAYSKQNNTQLIFQTNILGLVNIVNAASVSGFEALVQAGSSSEYGVNSAAPIEDEASLMPNSDYSVTKISAAYYINYLGKIKKLPVVNLRYYSIYGAYEESDRLIPRLLELGNQKKYPPLVNPKISRDFVYVDDAVEATIKAALSGVKNFAGHSINIASGKKTTLEEIVGEVKNICNIATAPEWGSMENRNWDLTDWYGNPAKAKKALEWEATTSLNEGLQKTLNWQLENYSSPILSPTPINKNIRISAIVACYKDAQAIPVMHERLVKMFKALNVDYEIIFVNDGSPDNTNEVIEKITQADYHVIGVEHSRNFSSQNAFLSGMAVSTGDAVVLMDGDLQDPPEIIPSFFAEWQNGNDVVYGRRIKRDGNQFLASYYKVFYRLFKKLSYINIPVDAGDFSMMDRKVVNELLALPETEQFLRGLRAWVGFKQTGVDYIRPERMFGVTTNNWRKNINWAKKGIFSFSFVPLEFLSYSGVILTLIAFLGIIIQIISKILHPDIPHGVATIIVLILFFGGLTIFGISILGEYIAKIFEETKKRPKYIRRSIRYGGKVYNNTEEINNFIANRK